MDVCSLEAALKVRVEGAQSGAVGRGRHQVAESQLWAPRAVMVPQTQDQALPF